MNRLLLPVDGPPIASEQDALDIIGEAMGQGAELVVIPVMRLSPEFFRLASSVAGAMLQKFTNYQLRVTIVGDVSAYTNRSVRSPTSSANPTAVERSASSTLKPSCSRGSHRRTLRLHRRGEWNPK